MESSSNHPSDKAPVAQVTASRFSFRALLGQRISWLWLVTAAALVLAVLLIGASWWARGPQITIRFAHGHSIEPGDRLRHRGIDIGEVTSVTLREDLGGVQIAIALDPSAAALAREGSQFWIERPQVSLTRVSGLETIVGGQYIAVLPGPADGARRTQFDGLESPPIGELAEGGMEIVLEADQLGGLHPRAPVTYRGVQVGRITSVGLATDAATVTAHAFIEPAYTKLIRDNTRFWRKGGVDMSVGLSGVQIDVESLSSVAIGGVSFATADPPGSPVKTGHTFVLHSKPEDDWLAWRPRVPVGSELLPGDASLPRPLRASLRWHERTFGFKRGRQRQGWVLPLEGERLLGPGNMLAPDLPHDTKAMLQVAGEEFALGPATGKSTTESGAGERLAVLEVGADMDRVQWWPVERIRAPEEPEDCLLVAATDASVLPISASRLTPKNGAWQIDHSLPLTANDYHGACAIAISDGKLIGMAIVDDDRKEDRKHVAVISEELADL